MADSNLPHRTDLRQYRRDFIWNSVAGLLNALQSTFVLFVLMRISDTRTAGIFTFAFANANVMLNIGKYGMRYFHVSDIKEQYTFSAFFTHRVFTTIIMLAVSVLYCLWRLFRSDPAEKILVCFLMCLLKSVDSLEDVFHGEYHRRGRLDLAGKLFTLRLSVSVGAFLMVLLLSGNLAESTAAAVCAAVLAFLYAALVPGRTVAPFPSLCGNRDSLREITVSCFPLFYGSFLILLIVNMPKYAIDALLSDEQQAIYAFVSMPLFIVALLAEFIFRPMVSAFTIDWNRREFGRFQKRMIRILLMILGITVICIAGGLTVGIPVLSFLYHFPLRPYAYIMALLLLGAGVLSLTSFMGLMITVMRAQRSLLPAYTVAAVVSVPLSRFFVGRFGLAGAAGAYLCSMLLLCGMLGGICVFHVAKAKKGGLP